MDDNRVCIAVDAMGGDLAPEQVVSGAIRAAREGDSRIVLVGDDARIHPLLPVDCAKSGIEVRHASEWIEMDESPMVAIRRKKDSSLAVCMGLLAEGQVHAVVTAGNTGAAAALAQMKLRRIEGIDRPAIATVLPSATGKVILLDSGANVDCRPQNLLEFAVMGTIYARSVLGTADPRVGLLSIGEESIKGNDLTKAAYHLLRESSVNFHGNVEGRDLGQGTVDIVVCDGFVGNIVLKVAEGYGLAILKMLKISLSAGLLSKIGLFLLRPGFRNFKKRIDYTEYGGALLLGVKGVCIISHGSSNAYAINNAIHLATMSVKGRIVDHIRESLSLPQPCLSAEEDAINAVVG